MDTNRHRESRFAVALAAALVGSLVVVLASLTHAVVHLQIFA